MKIEVTHVDHLEEIQPEKRAYLAGLVGPLDGYWETAVIGLAPHYKLTLDGRNAGYFAANHEKCLLQFYVNDDYLPAAPALFDYVLESGLVTTAAAGTVEPAYLSLCLDRQTAVAVNSYLFHDFAPRQPRLDAYPQAEFRPALSDDIDALTHFYGVNDEYADTSAIETGFGGHRQYAQSLVEAGSVFLLVDNGEILGVGECRVSVSQPPYADVGMITGQAYRRRGLGAFILAQLKEHCYRQQVSPICSCAFENVASRKTIEKAGFISRHRILSMTLASVSRSPNTVSRGHLAKDSDLRITGYR